MSSLGDIQQIHVMLQEISRLLDDVDAKTDHVTKKTEASTESFKELDTIALRYLTIAHRLGLPEDLDAALQTIALMIMALRQLQQTIIMTEAVLAGAGPIGWLALGASIGYTAFSLYALGRPRA